MKYSFRAGLVVAMLSLLTGTTAFAQTTFPPHGLHQYSPRTHAFTNCTLVTGPGEVTENATLVIRNGKVENGGSGIAIPADALSHDLKGAWIYPGFIDAYATYGFPPAKRSPGGPGMAPQYTSKTTGPYAWNQAIKPEFVIADKIKHENKSADKWRKLGFTTAHVVPNDGIFRGTSATINLGNRSLQHDLLDAQTTTCMSFNKGVSRQQYPSSLMGAIALIRQTFLDVSWYRRVQELRKSRPGLPESETNLSLQALIDQFDTGLPAIFEVRDWQTVLRAAALGKEFGLPFIYKTKGDEYKRLVEMHALGASFIVPLSFPKAPDVSQPRDAREVSLAQMLNWENAPTNPGRLAEQSIPFALTLHGLKNPKEFWPMLAKALKNGLSQEAALAALTETPAKMLRLDQQVGTLTPGKIANFFIADTNVFAIEKPMIYETWVSGERFSHTAIPQWNPSGQYNLTPPISTVNTLLIGGARGKWNAKVVRGSDTLDAKIKITERTVDLSFTPKKGENATPIRLQGLAEYPRITGTGLDAGGNRIAWTATRRGDYTGKKGKPRKQITPADLSQLPAVRFPNRAFGQQAPPPAETVLIENVTIWTNTDAGVIEGGSVVISDGKVQAVGQTVLRPPNARVIDGRGKHLTPGIIDEHSHIAISRGVNEGTHAVTAEVRIGDVINSEDVNIYRQLAGGVTTSQLLHGSANPIGGQSGIIKLRWGATPEEMKFAEAAPFIKFALGENVKQSNWGDNMRTRYPQTRLGVEQVIRDAFTAALDYRQRRTSNNVNQLPPRRDLQMETLLQILDRKRFVTCHSYQQAEITMLMRVAESFGFRINTFTHVLEGYKIADKLAEHGATGSSFSDWWAYKFEVIDAIPYNAAVMTQQGVNVCINSDDAEMGRRLNQEAAKAIKYGGLSEEEALKLVTLNPAKALHIDDYVGSVAVGKHADLVLWSDHPLSVYARALRTYVDGRLYYDAETDVQLQAYVQAERRRLEGKILAAPAGEKGKNAGAKGKRLYKCETLDSEYNK
ncbi:MAG: amidohydrolase family protein [Bacteroidota bacterium]